MRRLSFFLLVICSLFISFGLSHAQVITTIAGIGLVGYTGDHGAATLAKLTSPSGVAVDKYGNVFITDQNASCVRMVDTNGNITSVASNSTITLTGYSGDGGPATDAKLNWPEGLGIDDSGNLYIADQFNNVVRKVARATGVITTYAGNHALGGAYSGDGGPATAAGCWWPEDVTVDHRGNVYFIDQQNHAVRKVDAVTKNIFTIAGTGSAGYSGDGGPATNAKLSFPSGIVVDSSGNIYIADYYNNRLRKVTAATGIITTVAGNGTGGYAGDGGPATTAELWYPSSVALDDTGNLYISDFNNAMIRKVSAATGKISRIAGNDTQGYCCDCHLAAKAEINNPQGVAADKKGNIYIADYGNSRVRKVSDVFVCPVLETGEKVLEPFMKIFPNPSQGRFSVKFIGIYRNGILEIYDVMGGKQYDTVILDTKVDIELPDIPAGVYTVYYKCAEYSRVQKLIIAN